MQIEQKTALRGNRFRVEVKTESKILRRIKVRKNNETK